MYERCPTCGQLVPPPDDPTAARVAEWEAICAEHSYTIRAGRVSESTASVLLGIRKRLLAHRRLSSKGPLALHLPIDGSKWSYDLKELAAYELAHQEGEPWA